MKDVELQILRRMNEPLLAWFKDNKRELPWRENPDAYCIWVSEIMLQQTRVEAVKGYYSRFLEALPTIQALAVAKEDELLKLWEGLGYYNRVRNMQKAARTVMEQYDGVMPADYNALLALSGIGSYTAGAIASIAYQIPRPAVDGNVLRVIMRILELDWDISKQSVKKKVEQLLYETMPETNPGDYNQALMEIGATVCVPNGMPACEGCPLAFLCRGKQHNTMLQFPVKADKKPRKIEEKTVFVIVDGEHTVLRKRENHGLLAGLYELPNTKGWLDRQEALDWVQKKGFHALHIEPLPDAKHIFSHVEWRMKAYLIKVYETRTGVLSGDKQNLKERHGNPYLVIERVRMRDETAIPSAFSYYRKYLEP